MKQRIMTATVWNSSMDPTGWYLSEKFDGVRLFWDGSAFYSRTGRKLKVPEYITKDLPKVPLDGELW
jgi:DNA ligase-1